MMDIFILFFILICLCMALLRIRYEIQEGCRPEDDLSGDYNENTEEDTKSF